MGVVAGEGPVVGEREGLSPASRSNRLRLSYNTIGIQEHCEALDKQRMQQDKPGW